MNTTVLLATILPEYEDACEDACIVVATMVRGGGGVQSVMASTLKGSECAVCTNKEGMCARVEKHLGTSRLMSDTSRVVRPTTCSGAHDVA
jgi:hypothetical protein